MKTWLTSTRITRAQNVLWATFCVVLIILISGLIATNMSLKHQVDSLKQQLAAVQKSDACVARDAWKDDTSKTFTVESNGLNRQYIVHLPDEFQPDHTYPAVIYFSGKGKGAVDSNLHSGYNKLPAILIYPQPTVGKDGLLAWQGAPYSSDSDDVKFVGHLLDQVSGQLCIERSHIYAVGVSNGGGFAALLACQIPDRIRAFGMIAGAYYSPVSTCTPKQPAPIISIHGDNDKVVPYVGSALRKLPDIDKWAAHRASLDGCTGHPVTTHQDAATVTTWSTCRNNTSVRSIRQLGVGHTWTPADRDTIWKFLSSY